MFHLEMRASRGRRHDCLVALAPDFGQSFPGLPVVEGDEQEAGEGADERYHQRHDGNAAGGAQVGDATERPIQHEYFCKQ